MPQPPPKLPDALLSLPQHRRRAELADIIWRQMGVRVHPSVDGDAALNLLWYNIATDEVKPNLTNPLRDELMAFIKEYQVQLSLPCDGNCYGHTDARVLLCYLEFQKDNEVADLDLDILGGTM